MRSVSHDQHFRAISILGDKRLKRLGGFGGETQNTWRFSISEDQCGHPMFKTEVNASFTHLPNLRRCRCQHRQAFSVLSQIGSPM
jgi:hypothetical protein